MSNLLYVWAVSGFSPMNSIELLKLELDTVIAQFSD